MITLFRRIRQRLIESGSVTKYLIYAIGEILLVVIGILIALQVNNWNEERKSSVQAQNILRQIQADLEIDVEQADYIHRRYVFADSLNKRVAAGTLSEEDYSNSDGDESSVFFNYWYADFVISTISYERLKNLTDDLDSGFKELSRQLDELYVERRNNIEVYNQRIRNTVYENIDYLADNKVWYYKWDAAGVWTDEMAAFYLNDPLYKNQAQKYTNDLLNLARDAQTYRVKAIDLYHRIGELIGKNDEISPLMSYQLTDPEMLIRFAGSYVRVDDGSESAPSDTLKIILLGNELFLNHANDSSQKLYAHADQSLYREEQNALYTVSGKEGDLRLQVRDKRNSIWKKPD